MEVGAWLEIMAVLARWPDGWGTIGTVETDASSNSRSGSKGSNWEEIELTHSDHRPAIVSAGGIDTPLVALTDVAGAPASRKRPNRTRDR